MTRSTEQSLNEEIVPDWKHVRTIQEFETELYIRETARNDRMRSSINGGNIILTNKRAITCRKD